MANVFSTDYRCKALWRFESGALTADSKGGNTLTPSASSPTADVGDYREGAACSDFEADSSQYFRIADANLDAGFPLKSGDATKKFTLCCWFKLETVPGASQWANIYSKWLWQTDLTIEIGFTGGYLRVNWGYSASGGEFWDACAVQAGRWYHLAVVIDGVNRVRQVRLYDATAGTVANYSNTPSNQLRVGAADTTIGALANPGNYLDGKLDEMVIFNDILPDTEIDAIRNGVFPLPPKLKVFQAVAQAEWEAPPLIKVFQVIGQAEYQIPPLIKVPQIISQVEYRQFDPGLYVKQFIVQVEYQEIPPLTCRRKFPVPDARTAWQSQAGRRQFPVVQ
jgi:hypothetical protein